MGFRFWVLGAGLSFTRTQNPTPNTRFHSSLIIPHSSFFLLVTQALNRVEARGLARGPDAEDQPDEDGDDEAGDDRPERYRGGQDGEEEGDYLADADGEDDADDAADEGQGHCLVKKLPDDVSPSRADGLSDAYLLRALGHRDEHDVHHADSADEQADRGDSDGEQADHRRDAVELLYDLVGGAEVKVIRLVELHAATTAQNLLRLVKRLAQLT